MANHLKIALAENFGMDFYNFRIPFVKFLQEKGYQVISIVPDDEYASKILKEDIRVFTYSINRNGIALFEFIKTVLKIKKILKNENVQLLHTFRLQPNIFGTIAGRLAGSMTIINHITGLGYAFSNRSIKSKIYRVLIILLYNIVFRFSNKIIVQNPDDRDYLSKRLFCLHKKIVLIKGSGIDEKLMTPENADQEKIAVLRNKLGLNDSVMVFSLIARLIWEKGIREFAEASREVRKKYKYAKFILVGWFDENNPSTVSQSYLDKYADDIIFLGKRDDIMEILYLTDVYILPSFYREGIPRSILEAMSMKKAIITCNTPGCKLTVENGGNGYLIDPESTQQLVKAIEKIIGNREMIRSMGDRSREILIKNFSSKITFNQILYLYNNPF